MNTTTLDLDDLDPSDAPEAPQASASKFTLTTDQQTALDAIVAFLINPSETVFVLQGYSGCGKSTLIRTVNDQLPGIQKVLRLVNPNAETLEIDFTATTNKAAENLAQITGQEVKTIHSYLGLRIQTDYKTNVTTLVSAPKFTYQWNRLVVIDEASMMDGELLGYIFSRTSNCKFILVGDPAQLTQVKASSSPAFEAGFPGAALTQVVRQAEGNPIVALSTKFRHTVNTGEFFSFKPDGHHIQHMNRAAFNAAIEAEFTRPNWKYQDSKILGWTNKCGVDYNKYVRNLAQGDPHFQEGDYAVCNSFITVGKVSVKTDQLIQITGIGPDEVRHSCPGNRVTLDYRISTFQPKSLEEKNAAIKLARNEKRFNDVAEMESQWSDLRGAYACTINKAQGSTYDSVFIDLDDISRCNSGNQIARMMYVAVSRARHHVYLTGDFT